MSMFIRIVFVLLGAFCTAFGLYLRHKNAQAAAWPETLGEITHSAVAVDQSGDVRHEADIRYSYMVEGRPHSSGQFSFVVRDMTDARERRLVEAFPVGRKVRVYYDPSNPATAVLERQPSTGWAWLVVVGAVFSGLGFLAP